MSDDDSGVVVDGPPQELSKDCKMLSMTALGYFMRLLSLSLWLMVDEFAISTSALY